MFQRAPHPSQTKVGFFFSQWAPNNWCHLSEPQLHPVWLQDLAPFFLKATWGFLGSSQELRGVWVQCLHLTQNILYSVMLSCVLSLPAWWLPCALNINGWLILTASLLIKVVTFWLVSFLTGFLKTCMGVHVCAITHTYKMGLYY